MVTFKGVAASVVEHLGLLDMYSLVRRALTHSQVAILMYHHVIPESENPPWLPPTVSLEDFERGIAYLRKAADIVPLDSLVSRLVQKQPLPRKVVSITFDDGYKDNYRFAYPILRKYNLPATIFLTTGFIGNSDAYWDYKIYFAIWNTSKTELEIEGLGQYYLNSSADRRKAMREIIARLMELSDREKNHLVGRLLEGLRVEIPGEFGDEINLSWDEVMEMSKNGISFGAHTVTHPILTKLPIGEAKEEIARSKKDIEERLGVPCTSFAYPNGDFNDEIVGLVMERGFTCAVTTIQRMVNRNAEPFKLNRISAGPVYYGLKGTLSGFYLDLDPVISMISRIKSRMSRS
ncbi:MAG TPA: polysaccharide deacetylase family protein [Dehalococcoidia bacterium]|nr:polysaccharide deacetylase family protein [Dehalococcoidia bacterium]